MGPTGADTVGPGCHVAVVVDALSFTITLTVAADRGTLVAALPEQGWTGVSPEARAAAAAFSAIADDVGAALHACASGQELVDMGYPDDVDTAAQLDRSDAVPVLEWDVFVPR